MKQLIPFLLMLLWMKLAWTQTTYYSNNQYTDFNDIRGWGLNTDGSGNNPTLLGNQVILVQKHSKTTSGICTLRALHLQTGAQLNAYHSIYLDGTGKYFRIDSGATYIQQHGLSLGAALFSGTEIFAKGSTCEFRVWPPTLPGVDWANLIFNNPQSSSNCQLGGNTSQIRNNLSINSGNGIISLSSNTNLNLQVGGNIELESGLLDIANGVGIQATRNLNVSGNIKIKGGTIRCSGSSNKAWLQFTGEKDTLEIGNGIWNGQNIHLQCSNQTQLAIKGNIEIQAACSLVLAGSGSQVVVLAGNEIRNQGVLDARLGSLVFESGEGGTASYGESLGSFLGMGTFKQWIPAGYKRFRFFSSPVQNADFWQLQDDIHITGQEGPLNGFDSTATNNPSIYFYNETIVNSSPNIGWEAVTHVNQSMLIGKGYRVLVRGPRSNSQLLYNNSPIQPACSVSYFGPPHTGNLSISGLATYTPGNGTADGWNLLGNPYPSALNWEEMYQQGDFDSVYPYLYLRDAQSGNYVAWNGLTGMGTGSPLIPAYSGFLVQFFGTPAGSFKESRKQQWANPSYFKKNDEMLKIKISGNDLSDILQLAWLDSNNIQENHSEDIPKIFAATTLLASKNENGNWVCMDIRTREKDLDTIPLMMGGTGNLKLELLEKEKGVIYYLIDEKTGKTHEMNEGVLSFEVWDMDSLRFRIVRMVDQVNGLRAKKEEAKVLIYPNPATDKISIQLENSGNSSVRIEVQNLEGKTLDTLEPKREEIKTGVVEINLSDYASGVYTLKVILEKSILTHKFIVTKP